ncbi:MAG: peptidylprolyl isomerase [Bacteroidetes bacterium]|nr:peptidylprolyl isomerase [Bacteroidota bacterium]
MATLQNIRNRAGLLISIIIALALFAFVLGDLLPGGRGKGGCKGQEREIANIEGVSVPIDYYQFQVDKFIENYKTRSGQSELDISTTNMIMDQAWDFLIRETLMEGIYKDLGIDVSTEELLDMVRGRNIDPQVMQIPIFKNEAGMFDRNRVIQYLSQIENDPEQMKIWAGFEEDLIRSRKAAKYNNMIKKGYYVTGQQAKAEYIAANRKINMNYIVQHYNSIPDSLITISEEDINAWYDEHKNEYKREASRDFEYVVFEMTPSEADVRETEKDLLDLKPLFLTAENDEQFVNLNSDEKFDPTWYKDDELPYMLDSLLFNADTGTIYGTYREADAFKLSKLSDIKMLPDSVRARHILIKVDKQGTDYVKAKAIIDSLKTMVENGADFGMLAMQNSQDGSASQGGDLVWFKWGQMVQSFNDSCFYKPKDSLSVVYSEYGVHLVQVTDKGPEAKKVRIATITSDIDASTETRQRIYARASEFAGMNNTPDKFNGALAENNLYKRLANNVLENDKSFTRQGNEREVIRWAYQAEKGTVSPVFEIENRFLIALLTGIREEGIAPVDDVRTDIQINVTKEKKAEQLMEELKDLMEQYRSLEELATAIQQDVKTAEGATFSASNIPGMGVEPNVAAVASVAAKDQVYGPVEGYNGVYVIMVTDIVEPVVHDDLTLEKQTVIRGFINRVDYKAYEALKEISEIDDKRSLYY